MYSGNSDDQDLDLTSSFFGSFTHQNPSLCGLDQTRTHNVLDHRNDLIWSTGLSSDHDQHNYFENSCRAATTSSSSLTSRAQPQPGPSQNPSEPHDRAIRPGHQTGVIKNPKKRVRASHRVPTTVLKTDAANFRQMVQEFTGFPATSLQGSPYHQRPTSTLGPVYPVRPSAHKVLPSSSFPSLLPAATTDYVTPGGATLCCDLTNNSQEESTNHLSSNQLQDHGIPMNPSAKE